MKALDKDRNRRNETAMASTRAVGTTRPVATRGHKG
jgi:hypothetical protein